MKQDTTQATLFELVYDKTAILPVKIDINTYPTEPIIEDKPVKFKIEDKVLLHYTKVEKQWNGKFDLK
ncbi:hypothetical protein G9A89_019430 [Geosiphon pyriformis]|nr:hypothetical protein G9A89_019430 [Geosiphon pyriformis]